MCRYFQTRYDACTHFHRRTDRIGPGAHRVDYCPAVIVALEYWHLQIQYYPVEQHFGRVLQQPRACPLERYVHATPELRALWRGHNARLEDRMNRLGVDVAERQRIIDLQRQDGLTGNRELPPGQPKLGPYPRNWFHFVEDLHQYQNRPNREPNIRITNISRGCGFPDRRRDRLFACLEEWTFTDILMYRIRDWHTGVNTNEVLRLIYPTVRHPQPATTSREPWATNRVDLSLLGGLQRVMQHLGSYPHPASSLGNPPRVLPPLGPPLTPPQAPSPPSSGGGGGNDDDEPGSSEDQYPQVHERPSSAPGEPSPSKHDTPRRTRSFQVVPRSGDDFDMEGLQLSSQLTPRRPAPQSPTRAPGRSRQSSSAAAGPSTTPAPARSRQSSSAAAGPSTTPAPA